MGDNVYTVDGNKELMERVIESAEETLADVQLVETKYDGIISTIVAKAIERDSWQIGIIDKHLHSDGEDDVTMLSDHDDSRRLESGAKPKSTAKPKKQKEPEEAPRRQRRKKCHPAIEAIQDENGEYVVTMKPGVDIKPTKTITKQVTETIERCCQSKRVEQLRIERKRRQWTKQVAFVISRAVNTYLRRYTESQLPYRQPYRFKKDITFDVKATMQEQRKRLPMPLSYWFKMALRNELIVNEIEEMTPEEASDTMYQAVYNSKRAVQLSGRELKPQTGKNKASSSHDSSE